MQLIHKKAVSVQGNGLELRVYILWESGIPYYSVFNTCVSTHPTHDEVARHGVTFSSRNGAFNFFELAIASFVTNSEIDMTKIQGLLDVAELREHLKDISRQAEGDVRYLIEIVAGDRSYSFNGLHDYYHANDLLKLEDIVMGNRFNTRFQAESSVNRMLIALSQGSLEELFPALYGTVETITFNIFEVTGRVRNIRQLTSITVNV